MRRPASVSFGAYLALSVALYGRGVIGAPASTVVGRYGADQGVFIWSLGWWPHAISHGQNPLQTDLVYYPDGWNLAWTTIIGGPALLATPLTALVGATVAFNVLALLAPALDATCAFLLCRELTGRGWPAFAGGLVFGFSTYATSQTVNHLNLALVFCIPLAAYLCVRHARGGLSDRRFVLTLGAVLTLQFLTFLEVFLTLTGFALVGFAIAAICARAPLRRPLGRTFLGAAGAFVLSLAVCSPYLYWALAHPNPLAGHVRGYLFPLDLANLWTPTDVTGLHAFTSMEAARQLAGNLTEQSGYLGPIALAVLVLGPLAMLRNRVAAGCLVFAAAALVVAFGTNLTVNGDRHGRLPLAFLFERPLVEHVLPVRLTVYVWLAVAVIAAYLVASLPRIAGAALLAALAVTLAPTLEEAKWSKELAVPAFFDHGRWRPTLRAGDNVLVVPIAFQDNAMLWQHRAGYGFRMAGGYVAATVPETIWRFPIVRALYGYPLPLDADDQLRAFLRERRVDAIVLRDGTPGVWRALFDRIGPGVSTGGVRVWRVPAAVRTPLG